MSVPFQTQMYLRITIFVEPPSQPTQITFRWKNKTPILLKKAEQNYFLHRTWMVVWRKSLFTYDFFQTFISTTSQLPTLLFASQPKLPNSSSLPSNSLSIPNHSLTPSPPNSWQPTPIPQQTLVSFNADPPLPKTPLSTPTTPSFSLSSSTPSSTPYPSSSSSSPPLSNPDFTSDQQEPDCPLDFICRARLGYQFKVHEAEDRRTKGKEELGSFPNFSFDVFFLLWWFIFRSRGSRVSTTHSHCLGFYKSSSSTTSSEILWDLVVLGFFLFSFMVYVSLEVWIIISKI